MYVSKGFNRTDRFDTHVISVAYYKSKTVINN